MQRAQVECEKTKAIRDAHAQSSQTQKREFEAESASLSSQLTDAHSTISELKATVQANQCKEANARAMENLQGEFDTYQAGYQDRLREAERTIGELRAGNGEIPQAGGGGSTFSTSCFRSGNMCRVRQWWDFSAEISSKLLQEVCSRCVQTVKG